MLNPTEYEKLLTDEASSTVTYVGYAIDAYSSTADAVWCILKIESASGTSPSGVTTYKWSPSKGNFGSVWNDRATLTYN
jgi:hypothetical protein